ncbi:hypothetical protein GAV44_23290 [Salmonella enterica subsp. enterica serovar Newport]|nr:hypothetical protein [Salmonella enterica subsp. enterica serovar Newport]
MQWLIVPAVLAVLSYFNVFPSMPGFAYVILIVVYLIAATLETKLIGISKAQRENHAAIMEKLDLIEMRLENKVDNVESEIRDLKWEITHK